MTKPLSKPVTLQQAMVYFSDADRAFQYAVELRWPDGKVSCPRCGSDKHSFVSTRKIWFCKGCKKQFTLKVGTIFEDSPLGIEKWMAAFWMITNCKNGISSYEISRMLGVTQKSAWFMLHRIREALKSDTTIKFGGPESGTVELDDTFVGGKVKNMHKNKRPRGPGVSGRPVAGTAKTIVVGMLERPGCVRAEVVFERTNAILHGIANKHLAPGTKLVTDEWGGYKGNDFVHEIINHADAYVRGQVHTNGIENFWSLLKRSLHGTYISVEPYHLHQYINEQAFRYNNRATKDNPLDDRDRFTLAMSQTAGKRLTYAALIGRAQGVD
ncbi:MAG TPA: IS1595 family transposase [Edaphobacter sp.]|nr:IS1595 family transposase [Edaphobacter sp.]